VSAVGKVADKVSFNAHAGSQDSCNSRNAHGCWW
jgi:hypothetical protein